MSPTYNFYCYINAPGSWGRSNYSFNRPNEPLFRSQPGCESHSILGPIHDPDVQVLTVYTAVGSGLDYYQAHAVNPDP